MECFLLGRVAEKQKLKRFEKGLKRNNNCCILIINIVMDQICT